MRLAEIGRMLICKIVPLDHQLLGESILPSFSQLGLTYDRVAAFIIAFSITLRSIIKKFLHRSIAIVYAAEYNDD